MCRAWLLSLVPWWRWASDSSLRQHDEILACQDVDKKQVFDLSKSAYSRLNRVAGTV